MDYGFEAAPFTVAELHQTAWILPEQNRITAVLILLAMVFVVFLRMASK